MNVYGQVTPGARSAGHAGGGRQVSVQLRDWSARLAWVDSSNRKASSFVLRTTADGGASDGGGNGERAPTDVASLVAAAARASQQPWELGTYYTKKLERRTDLYGNLVKTPDVIADPLAWGDDAKLALAVRVVAGEEGLSEAALRERVDSLLVVLPGLLNGGGGGTMLPADVARLAARGDGVAGAAEAALAVKRALPGADAARILAGAPRALLLLQQRPVIATALDEAVALFGGDAAAAGAVLEAAPHLLAPGALAAALGELRRLFGGGGAADPVALLARDPSLALSVQGLRGQERGGRDAEYVDDAFGERKGAAAGERGRRVTPPSENT